MIKIYFTKLFLMLAFLFGVSSINAQLTQSDIVYYLPFDGNSIDQSSAPTTFTATGFVTYQSGSDAKFGQSAKFDGATSLLAGTGFDTTNPHTVAAWFRVAATHLASSNLIMHHVNGSGNGKYFLQVRNDDLISTSTTNTRIDADNAIAGDTWYHAAVVFDGTDIYLYENGVPVSASPVPTASGFNDGAVTIGANKSQAGAFLEGNIDDLVVANRALSQTEIQQIRNNGVTATLLGVDNASLKQLGAYPNPVNNRLYFSSNNLDSVEIYNVLGAKISSQKVVNGVDMNSLSKGIYLVKCRDYEGQDMGTIKIVKE